MTFNDGVLFRTKEFEPDYRYTLNFVDAWSVDEIVVLDVTRNSSADRSAFKQRITSFAKNCFVPMAAGGGIRSLKDVHEFLDLGADKVVINTGAVLNPTLITETARAFGKQCVVASMDVTKSGNGYQVMSHFGRRSIGKNPVTWAQELEDLGAGEIIVSSIDLDGSLQGYDLDLCQQVAEAVKIPVLICGGAGNWKHFAEGFKKGKADAVCTTNIYHFTETSIQSAKDYLTKAGILVRN